MKIDNSSFNNQLNSAIYEVDLFYRTFTRKYNSGKMKSLGYNTAGPSFYREDILIDSKEILEILRSIPPRNSEELKKFFEKKIIKLEIKDLETCSPGSSLLKLIKNIVANLEIINSNGLNENSYISFS